MASHILLVFFVLISLNAAQAHARILSGTEVEFGDASNYKGKGARYQSSSAYVSCNTCKNVVHSALKTAHHFVGQSDVMKAARHFCDELAYQGIIGFASLRDCVQRIKRKAETRKRPVRSGVAYLRADDICMYVGSCNAMT